jgi:hypothetical protein
MTRLHYLYVLAGAVVFLILHIHFVVAWESLYAHHPWTGYAPGRSPAFFSSSPKSLAIASAVLLVMALALTVIPPGQRAGIGGALWAGVMIAVVLIWVATARLRQDSNMWPIDFVFLAVQTGVPIGVGRTIGLVYWRIRIGQRLNARQAVAAVACFVIGGWAYLIFH